MAVASSSSAMRWRDCRDRRTAGLSDATSLRFGFGGCAPEAMKAARPPHLHPEFILRGDRPVPLGGPAGARAQFSDSGRTAWSEETGQVKAAGLFPG
jgi:hypothetical protein